MAEPLRELEAVLAEADASALGPLPHVAARLLNTPLAIAAPKLHAILAAIGPRLGLTVPPPALALRGAIRQDRSRSYQVLDGVAVLPLMGTIVKRNASGLLESSGMVSTEAAGETLLAALRDPNVRAILLQMDSYGGEANGTGDLADLIFRARTESEKPIWGIADEAAFSAGYYVLSAASRVVLPQNGGVGSIGVIAVHVDESKMLEQAGLAVTAVYAGARKNDFTPFAPLSETARGVLQAEVERVYGLFVDAVARQRHLSAAAVRATEASTFQGADAVRAGLADAVLTFDDVLAELADYVNGAGASRARGGSRMGKEKDTAAGTPAADAKPAEVVSLEDVRKERQAGEAAGTERERKRVKGIRELAQLSRLPGAKATALADQLVDEGTDVEEARTRFLKAQATAQSAVEMRPALAPDGEGLPAKPARRPAHEVYTEREQVLAQARRW